MWFLIAAAVAAVAGAALTAGAAYAQPPATPPVATQPPQNATPGAGAPAGDAADEGFIEFLGSDDVGDAAWWEFLKRAPPRGDTPPAPPSQDANK